MSNQPSGKRPKLKLKTPPSLIPFPPERLTRLEDIRPSAREMKVLEGLCLGDIETADHFPGVGKETFEAMLIKDWIEPAVDETYGTHGFRITEAGQKIHERWHDR